MRLVDLLAFINLDSWGTFYDFKNHFPSCGALTKNWNWQNVVLSLSLSLSLSPSLSLLLLCALILVNPSSSRVCKMKDWNQTRLPEAHKIEALRALLSSPISSCSRWFSLLNSRTPHPFRRQFRCRITWFFNGTRPPALSSLLSRVGTLEEARERTWKAVE
jgi:hypothetical protein